MEQESSFLYKKDPKNKEEIELYIYQGVAILDFFVSFTNVFDHMIKILHHMCINL